GQSAPPAGKGAGEGVSRARKGDAARAAAVWKRPAPMPPDFVREPLLSLRWRSLQLDQEEGYRPLGARGGTDIRGRFLVQGLGGGGSVRARERAAAVPGLLQWPAEPPCRLREERREALLRRAD